MWGSKTCTQIEQCSEVQAAIWQLDSVSVDYLILSFILVLSQADSSFLFQIAQQSYCFLFTSLVQCFTMFYNHSQRARLTGCLTASPKGQLSSKNTSTYFSFLETPLQFQVRQSLATCRSVSSFAGASLLSGNVIFRVTSLTSHTFLQEQGLSTQGYFSLIRLDVNLNGLSYFGIPYCSDYKSNPSPLVQISVQNQPFALSTIQCFYKGQQKMSHTMQL